MKRYKDHKQFRLPYFNYASTGLYFITICTRHRIPYFGKIVNGSMQYSEIGKIADTCIRSIPAISEFANVDSYVIMPDHVHSIIAVENEQEERTLQEIQFRLRKHSLSTIVLGFKRGVTLASKQIGLQEKIWQPRFFDRIIRNEIELSAVRNYIQNNPLQWECNHNGILPVNTMDEHLPPSFFQNHLQIGQS
jgi:REP element-mobilizing transposase RayT